MGRFESVKASLRSLQIDADRERAANKKHVLDRVEFYFSLIDEAFEVMNRPKPIRESKADREVRTAMSLSQEMSAR